MKVAVGGGIRSIDSPGFGVSAMKDGKVRHNPDVSPLSPGLVSLGPMESSSDATGLPSVPTRQVLVQKWISSFLIPPVETFTIYIVHAPLTDYSGYATPARVLEDAGRGMRPFTTLAASQSPRAGVKFWIVLGGAYISTSNEYIQAKEALSSIDAARCRE